LGRLKRRGGLAGLDNYHKLLLLGHDNESCDDAGNPPYEGENGDEGDGAAASVEDSEGREEDTE